MRAPCSCSPHQMCCIKLPQGLSKGCTSKKMAILGARAKSCCPVPVQRRAVIVVRVVCGHRIIFVEHYSQSFKFCPAAWCCRVYALVEAFGRKMSTALRVPSHCHGTAFHSGEGEDKR